uniref:ATP synthase complex subunit 8 n=1 Tax=Chrysolina aeruginosa TaxID=640304 RepID=A0A7H0R0C8_9CUCU|nr:ATP synthase F0 subunit 8 [Chrysolina aeruginosa]QNQ64877.1 ATP synthase F0 subunit 8 [Chrysolina aeruginosa]QUB07127.1 ATP synthase F0 subunit 8 [Chrysochus chinensis]
MPQMAPMMWTLLFVMFTIILILFISSNFFMKNYYPKNKTFMKNKNLISWKW